MNEERKQFLPWSEDYKQYIYKSLQLYQRIQDHNEDPKKILELIVDSANEIAGLELSQQDPAESVDYAKKLIFVWHNIFILLELDHDKNAEP